MEGMSDCVSKYVPSFAKGLQILLVDNDPMSLVVMATMLEQCSYKVTTTDRASVALSMIQEKENCFRLVIANINLPDMDTLSILRASHQRDIRVIMMSSERNADVADKALAEGASLFLIKPVSLDELKYLWQHACWKNVNLIENSEQEKCHGKGNNGKESDVSYSPLKETGGEFRPHSGGIVIKEAGELYSPATTTHDKHGLMAMDTNCKKQMKWHSCSIGDDGAKNQEGSKSKRLTKENEGEKRGKKTKINSEHKNSESLMINTEKGKEKKTKDNSNKEKRSRVVWDSELYHKFATAISVLGDEKAQPRTIQKEMKVPNITLLQIASHLQKYKAEVQHIQDNESSLPSSYKLSCFHARTQVPAPLEQQNSQISQLGRGNMNFVATENTFPTTPKSLTQAEMNLPKFNYAPSEAGSPCLSTSMFQFPSLPPQANQNQDLASVINSKYQNQDQLEYVPATITSSDATNSQTHQTNLSDGSQNLDAIVNQAPRTSSSSNQNQPVSECADILKILEDYDEEPNNFSWGSNFVDFDRYCDWLEKRLDGKD